MKILLINPPNCGRSIPEEEYGITSLKMIFRGEPLALETLAGNLLDHEVAIADLKAEPDSLDDAFLQLRPDLVGITGVTCEANCMVRLAERCKSMGDKKPVVVVGGHHASCDPQFFHRDTVDFVVAGLGKLAFRELVDALAEGKEPEIAGVAKVRKDQPLKFTKRRYSLDDLVDHLPPRYELVARNRDKYVMSGVGGKAGFVSTAFGCTHGCAFCSIPSMTDGRYLSHSVDAVLRDIQLLAEIPLIRLVDANTFGDLQSAEKLASRLLDLGLGKRFVADVRADTVVGAPQLMALWKQAGLAAVVIGFEEIDDNRLKQLNKRSSMQKNLEALTILEQLDIKVIGDFIINPDYEVQDFERLTRFIEAAPISLPIPSILTPIPGTQLYRRHCHEVKTTDLDYYTFSNAVLPTTLPEKEFYLLYSDLMKHLHQHITPNR